MADKITGYISHITYRNTENGYTVCSGVIDEELNGEIINLGTEEEHTTQQGIAYVEELLGIKIGMEIISERPGDQLRTLANIDKARKLLGYNPSTSLKEGLKLQIDWYKTEFL